MSTPSELVAGFLRAQNLEHVSRVEEAIELYERCVAASFDSAGPYDRLIVIYSGREAHADVARVASAALDNVRTHPERRTHYRETADRAREASERAPDARGAEF